MSHPISVVTEFCSRHAAIRNLEFGVYRYTPQAIDDDRRIVSVSTYAIDVEVKSLASALEGDQELAMHSRVTLLDGSIQHLPMVDFVGHLSPSHIDRIAVLAAELDSGVAIFESGRSFHAYFLTLLAHNAWLKFLGRLLLLNAPDENQWVDIRWVGHGLLAGFSSLRWTHHTKTYRAVPQLVWSAPVLHSTDTAQ